jgi:GNAT superfamily N-acetyltransferase
MIFRPGNTADLPQLHDIFVDSVWDLAWRMGLQEGERYATPQERAVAWSNWRPILEHLTATGDQFWVAEENGNPFGYARSIMRDGVRELTEFFVSPQAQTGGVGRELLARTMPLGAKRNYIIATIDLRAQARYQKLGIYQICAIFTFLRKPERLALSGELKILPITPDHLPLLANLDHAVHGHSRNEDHAWLMTHRHGFLLQRHEQPVGYGYVGHYSGPFVMLNEADYPAARNGNFWLRYSDA